MHDTGEESCAEYGTKCNTCPLYKKWAEFKKYAHDIKLPLTMENHLNEVNEKPDGWYNPEVSMKNLIDYLKKNLEPLEFRIFELAFLQNHTDDEVFKALKSENFEIMKKNIKGIKLQITKKTRLAVYSDNLEIMISQ